MKKNLFLMALALMLAGKAAAQATTYMTAPPNNGATSAFRAPNGTSADAYFRGCSLVLASELSGSLTAGTNITSFGFLLVNGNASVPVTGNFTLYLQHTSDVTYQKGTSWASIPTGMTAAYTSTMTIPVSSGNTSITITLPSSFTYTGGGLYVAYDWSSTGPFDATGSVFVSNNTLSPGCTSGAATTAGPAPGTLVNSAFRPCFLFGSANTYTNDIQVIDVIATGKVVHSFNTPQSIVGIVKNASNMTQNNINVSLNVTGANTFTNVQTIGTLTAGAVTTVTFAAFTPTNLGSDAIAVSVPADQNAVNNQAAYAQSVTCQTWAQNPVGNYTGTPVGFGTGSGILATPLTNAFTTTLTGLRAAVSTDTNTPGNSIYGVLLSSTGATLAVTPPITLTNGMLGTFQNFSFASPQILTAGTTYYIGFAQIANATVGYFPAGTYQSAYVDPTLYVNTTLAGGALTPLTTNFGYFGIEAVFQTTLNVSTVSQTVTCGNAATVTALSPTNYSWTTGATTSSIVVTPTANTVYTVTATNAVGCSASQTATVTVTPLQLSTVSQTVTCGNTATVTALSPTNYSWTTGATTSSIAVTPSVNTVYTVTANNAAGCTVSKTATVTVNPLQISASASGTNVCQNSSVTLTGSGATSYTWTLPGTGVIGTGTSIVTSPQITANYLVAGSNTVGCSAAAAINIHVNGLPIVGITNAQPAVCLGSAATMTATGASTYTWSTGTASNVLTDSPLTNTVYAVNGTDANGCVNSSTTAVTVNSVVLSITGTTVICAGRTATLVANGASTYIWNNQSPFAEYHVTPTVTTVYTVTGTDNITTCSGTQTVSVLVNPKPVILASATKTAMCVGESATLSASGASTYSWAGSNIITSGGVTVFNPIIVTPAQQFTVTGVDANSCSNNAVLSLIVAACTGIGENGITHNSSVYPNPNNGTFTIAFDAVPEQAAAEIYNALGSQVKKQTLFSASNSIDLGEMPNGMYLVYISVNGKTLSVAKIVKQ